MQFVVIIILFALATFYLGRMVYRSFKANSACESGCGKCGVASIDVDKIAKEIRKKETFMV